MDLLTQIKADRMAARMNKDVSISITSGIKARLLTTLVGEAETALKGKQAKKFDMLKLINTFAMNLKESLRIKYTADQHQELQILEEYLPKQLTDSEIAGIISLMDFTTVGDFFGYMNKTFKGQFDGKRAGELYKLER